MFQISYSFSFGGDIYTRNADISKLHSTSHYWGTSEIYLNQAKHYKENALVLKGSVSERDSAVGILNTIEQEQEV